MALEGISLVLTLALRLCTFRTDTVPQSHEILEEGLYKDSRGITI